MALVIYFVPLQILAAARHRAHAEKAGERFGKIKIFPAGYCFLKSRLWQWPSHKRS
jgi:hypothetical protein